MLDKNDMGLYLLQLFWSPFLKIGITLACFKISGKVPDEEDKLIRLDIGLDKHFFEIFRNSGRNTTWASCFVCF